MSTSPCSILPLICIGHAVDLCFDLRFDGCNTVVNVLASCCRMIFGFRAMDNLKAHTISYSVTKGAYDKYFNSLSGDWNAAYVSNDEDTTELNKVLIIASALMLSPLLFLAIKILSTR